MKTFFTKHWLALTGVGVGTLGGYLYYYFVGCVNGACNITSNPYKMMIFGAVIGYLLFDLFSHNNSPKKTVEITEKNDQTDKE
jgi:hypothetical protein